MDAAHAGSIRADGDDGSPFGESQPHFVIGSQALAEVIQTEGDLFTGEAGEIGRAFVDLDPGDNTRPFQYCDKGDTVLRRLVDGLVEHYRAAQALTDAG